MTTKIYLTVEGLLISMSNDKEKKLGVIIDDINKEDREEWANNLINKLEDLDGVEEGFIDSGSSYYQDIIIHLKLKSEWDDFSEMYDINVNLRSLAQKIRSILDSDKFVSANILDPEITESPNKKNGKYDKDYYRLKVYYP